MDWGVLWYSTENLIQEINYRCDASLVLISLLTEISNLRQEFQKKMRSICKKHHLKTNKTKDSCFNAFYALFDFCQQTADFLEQSAKQTCDEIGKVNFAQEIAAMSKTKERVLEQLKKDKDFIVDARKTLQKAKFENERRAKAHYKALNSYNKHRNSKDSDKYRITYTDKLALFEELVKNIFVIKYKF